MAQNTRPDPNGPAPYKPNFRVSRVRAQVKQLRDNRARWAPYSSISCRTPAGTGATKAELLDWIDDDRVSNPALGRIVEVYIEQLCYYVNKSKGIIGANAPGNLLRAMLSVPQSFYTEISGNGNMAGASQLLRSVGITAVEFAQLEYFFIPIEYGEHSSLLAVSPRHRKIELCDSENRTPRAIYMIFRNIIRFLIHELSSLSGPGPWMFKYNESPKQHWASECGNFTCFYAKALATYQPLTQNTDIGQGTGTQEERTQMRFRVVDELLLRHGWSAMTHPIGNEALYGPAARHSNAPFANQNTQPGPSEPQHRLLWNFQGIGDPAKYDVPMLRSRTGRFDHLDTNAQLAAWCGAQPQLRDNNGNGVPRMHGYQNWQHLPWKEFVRRVELREMLIANGGYP
jgi:hypothetical protein